MRATVSAVVKPKVDADRKYLHPDEAARLIAAAGKRGRHGFRDLALLRLTNRHGMRVTEAVEMRWAQIDPDGGRVRLHAHSHHFVVSFRLR